MEKACKKLLTFFYVKKGDPVYTFSLLLSLWHAGYETGTAVIV